MDKLAQGVRVNQMTWTYEPASPGSGYGIIKIEGNRVNQCNPNHLPSGTGHKAEFDGNREKAAMDNKANQQNPNHSDSKQGK